MKIKRWLIVLGLTLSFTYSNKAAATWSIILVDERTHEIGIAGASCTHNCYGIGRIVPNIGAIIVQAMSNGQARMKGMEMILAETTPEQIVAALRNPEFSPERQQYAVVTIKSLDKPAVYTGDSTAPVNGALTSRRVSVQGNILAADDELKIIMQAVEKGQHDSIGIADILMVALEAGSLAGGDRRCGAQKAASAFITVMKPDDKEPYLDLNIMGQDQTGENAVEMLRNEFEKRRKFMCSQGRR